MEDTKPLIQQLYESSELTPIKEDSLKAYYTCVRYKNVKENGIVINKPAQWSCMKGWFESHDGTFHGTPYDSKVVNFCSFRNTEVALKKELGSTYSIVHLNENSMH